MNEQLNTFELSRKWFNYGFDNPDKIKPIHSAIYFFAIEHCNRLGWKRKFGFPSQMVMEAIGVRNWRTYSKGLNDLVDFGFIDIIETSKNQYSSNIIAIVKNTKAPTKALDKALQKHSTKQGQSTVSINKQTNKEQITINEQLKEDLFNSYQLIEAQMKVHNTSKKEIIKHLTHFWNIKYEGIETESSLNDIRKHFNNWLAKQDVKKVLEPIKHWNQS
jgi:hypothetical protein